MFRFQPPESRVSRCLFTLATANDARNLCLKTSHYQDKAWYTTVLLQNQAQIELTFHASGFVNAQSCVTLVLQLRDEPMAQGSLPHATKNLHFDVFRRAGFYSSRSASCSRVGAAGAGYSDQWRS